MIKDTIMISMDTSTQHSGIAVWVNAKLTEYFAIIKPKSETNGNEWMTKELYKIIDKYKPQIVITEAVNVDKNFKTMATLISLIGKLQGYYDATDDSFRDELPPNVWRKLVASEDEPIPTKRVDTKPWAIKKIKELFNFDEPDDNVCEAILIGQAYINYINCMCSEEE